MSSTPSQLVRYMGPGIDKLMSMPWFQIAQEYFANPPEIDIIEITPTQPQILNVLDELLSYINRNYDNLVEELIESPKNRLSNSQIANALRKIQSLLDKIDPHKLTKSQRHSMRKHIEISPIGKHVLTGFYEDLKSRDLIDPDLELILNPFTSLINLAEIYAQCDEYTMIRYSVPELGIYRSKLHLYYPESKRNQYITIEQTSGKGMGEKSWLSDAIHRICFFNKLLNTQKQPRGIHVFLCEFRKEFMRVQGKEDLVFTSSEINTGVCNMVDIIITRSEESLKTLFHELIHFHSLDFKHALHDKICERIFNIDTQQSSFNLFEAHTECMASILHCITRTPSDMTQDFNKIFTYQVWYTIKKAAQILTINNCSALSEFIHLDTVNSPSPISIASPRQGDDSDKCQPLKESTNVFSYFFVKTFIYLGLAEWLDGCCNARTCKFIDTEESHKNLLEIIKSGASNPLLYKLIDSRIDKEEDTSLKMVWIK